MNASISTIYLPAGGSPLSRWRPWIDRTVRFPVEYRIVRGWLLRWLFLGVVLALVSPRLCPTPVDVDAVPRASAKNDIRDCEMWLGQSEAYCRGLYVKAGAPKGMPRKDGKK